MSYYRCYQCGRLTLDVFISRQGGCKCGCKRVTGASPRNIIEKIKGLWWLLTVREEATNG